MSDSEKHRIEIAAKDERIKMLEEHIIKLTGNQRLPILGDPQGLEITTRGKA